MVQGLLRKEAGSECDKAGIIFFLAGGRHSKGRLAKTFLGNCTGMPQNAGPGDLCSPLSLTLGVHY